ncbi:MAG: hypothetical protein U1E05_20560, partial [Patescibacteria group bacterium]|nr:hypothetical protein [Patescibacteria group bacterium]
VMASLAIVLACGAVPLSIYRYHAKAQAIKHLREHGARVFDIPMKGWFSVEFHADAKAAPPLHDLLAQLRALPPFSLCFVGRGFSDDSIGLVIDDLRQMPRLRGVSLINTQITDSGVARLQNALPHCRVHARTDPEIAERQSPHNNAINPIGNGGRALR